MTSKQKIDRREFLMLVGAASGSVALAACAPGATTVPAPVEAPAVQALKTVRYALSQTPTSADTLDPAFRVSGTDSVYQRAAYEQLVERDESLSPFPLLAESWEANETATEWTFKLREGVTFSNGKPFVAADVVYTYQRLIDPDVGSTGAGNLSNVDPDGIEAIDDHTVRIKLIEPDVDFPGTTVFSQSPIVPEGMTNADLATQSFGTGPFKIDSFTPGETTQVFVKNENYWQPGKPGFDVLEMISVPDAEARLAGLRSGQLDIIFGFPSSAVADLESDPEFNIVANPLGGMPGACCQIDVPPFDDNNVRLAMKYATDRQAMIDLVSQGFGTPMNDVMIPQGVAGGLQGVREHDVEKAKELLSMSGYDNGIDLPALKLSSVNDLFIPWTTAWQQQLAEAGIRFELDVNPADTYWDEVWLNEPFYMTSWGTRAIGTAVSLFYASEANWNETHWFREDYDELLAQSRATADVDERNAIYAQMQQMLIDEGGHFVPYVRSTLHAVRSNISGWFPFLFEVFRDIKVS